MANRFRMLTLAAVALSASACLQKDTTHTLYLSPDGAVAWVIEEKGVYSDEEDLAKRQAEEDAYLAEVKGGAHKLALGLADLGPERLVRTRVLRDERPFHVVTEGRFGSVESMMQRLFYQSGLDATVTVTEDDGQVTLRIAFDFSLEPAERESPASALLEDFDKYAFVLTDGEFVSGTGFNITGSMAKLSEEWSKQVEKQFEDHGSAELVLTWKR